MLLYHTVFVILISKLSKASAEDNILCMHNFEETLGVISETGEQFNTSSAFECAYKCFEKQHGVCAGYVHDNGRCTLAQSISRLNSGNETVSVNYGVQGK